MAFSSGDRDSGDSSGGYGGGDSSGGFGGGLGDSGSFGGGGMGSGIGDSSYGGNSDALGGNLGIGPDSFSGDRGGSSFNYTDNVMDIPGMDLSSMFSTNYGPSFSTDSISNDWTSGPPAAVNAMGVTQDDDFWNSGWGRFVKGLGKFALSTNPIGRAGLTAYGLYNAAQNKDYGSLAQGLVGAATGNGLYGSIAGIGTRAALGQDVRGPVGSTLGGMVGGGIAGPVGGMIGSQVGRDVATSNRAPVGGSPYGDRTIGGGGSRGLDVEQLVAGLGNMYLNNRAARGAERNVQDLGSMFGPNSAYASQLKQQLERRDAAAGRRSQYGPREVELQAKLAQMAAQYGPNISQSNMAAQEVSNRRRQQNLSTLYAMARESGLVDQLSGGLNNMFSSAPSYSLYMDSTGSGTSFRL